MSPPTLLNRLLCPHCSKMFTSQRGCTGHVHTVHPDQQHPQADSDSKSDPVGSLSHAPEHHNTHSPIAHPDDLADLGVRDQSPEGPYVDHALAGGTVWKEYHPYLTTQPCDESGVPLPPGHPPSSRAQHDPTDWSPFTGQHDFLLADFLFRHEEMSAGNINHLMGLWAFQALQQQPNSLGSNPSSLGAPFLFAAHMYATIDQIQSGGAPWECMKVSPNMNRDENLPSWKRAEYEVWYCDVDCVLTKMLDNADFKDKFDYRSFTYTDSQGQ
ncbi:hypothetical protein JVU11DRAFT_1940 [Chiua virens]|nr:hypothetical protein JVU11DRAFT_1940 [Chiua virens]